MSQAESEVNYLLTPKAVRERCEKILRHCLKGKGHFRVRLDKLDDVADRVVKVIGKKYPDLKIPYHSRWNHFRIGGVDRVRWLEEKLKDEDALELARTKIDLVITSVLLDAGAGPQWQYREESTQRIFARSEGLAVASFHMFMQGDFSSDVNLPLQADSRGMMHVTESRIKDRFQVSVGNPLVGTSGRTHLIHELGKVVEKNKLTFRENCPRPGCMIDYFLNKYPGKVFPVSELLKFILKNFNPIWPGRVVLHEVNLGDVWHYPALGKEGTAQTLVPFHKLSQWLTYSLIEVFEECGFQLTDLDDLTALAEYRNGGLLIDSGLIEFADVRLKEESHNPHSPLVVEWRALTVALIDSIAESVRTKLHLTAEEFPLAKVLEGGTWWAGRELAGELRDDGRPPLKIISDGTVF